MKYDALVKRTFPLLVCVLLATAAHFQATGFAALMDAMWAASTPPIQPSPQRAPPRDAHEERASGAIIVARNPFDSVTGPLDATGAPLDQTLPAKPLAGNPHEDPVCDAGRVTLIAASDDPAWSFAVIVDSARRALLRRQGDEIAGGAVQAIAWDRVWLTVEGARCQLRLGDVAKPAKPSTRPAPKPGNPGRGRLPREISERIQRISERDFNVDRTAIDLILEKQSELLRTARMLPVKEDGKVVGFRLLRVAGDSLLGALGMKTGDQVRSINGFSLADPQKALEAYTRLRTAENLTVALQRDGKDTSIAFHIR